MNQEDREYRVGDFIVDSNAAHVVAPDGQVCLLKEKALKTLLVFLQSPGQFHTNETLIELVYGNVSIGTSTVAQNIKQIREAFQDNEKTIIENRLKVGYRLTLPVTVIDSDLDPFAISTIETSQDPAEESLKNEVTLSDNSNGSEHDSERQDGLMEESMAAPLSLEEVHPIEEANTEESRQIEPNQNDQSEVYLEDVISTSKENENKANFWQIGFAMLFFAAVGILGFKLSTPQISESLGALKPLTHSKGQEYFPSLSKDGKWLIYSHRNNKENWKLHIRDMESGKNTKLLGDQNYQYKHGQLTRDGRSVLFSRIGDGQCDLMKASFDLSSKTVSDLKVLQSCEVSSEGAKIIEAHLPDHYVYTDSKAIDAPFSLFTYSTVSGQSERLTAPPSTGRGDYYMSLSPDGNRIALLRNVRRFVTEIRLLDLHTRNDVLVDTVHTTLFTVNWSFAGDSLVYKDDSNQVVMWNLARKQREVIKQTRFPIYAPFMLDESNTRVGLIGGSLSDRDIVAFNLEDQQKKVLLDSSFSDTMAVYSPDKEKLAWVSNRNGLFQLWVREGEFAENIADGEERLLSSVSKNGRFTSLDFNHDGTKLGGTFEGRWFIYDFLLDEFRWSDKSDHHYHNFAWRADGGSAFIQDTYAYTETMNLLDIDTGTVSRYQKYPGAHLVKESPDGRWIFAWFRKTHRFIRVDQSTDHVFEISTLNQGANANQWVVTNDEFVWVDQPAKGPAYLKRLSHQGENILEVRKESYFGPISMSNVDRVLLMSYRGAGNSELYEI